VLVDLHEPRAGSGNLDKKSSTCGPLNVHSYQKLKAIEWAVEIINNKSWPGEFSLGNLFLKYMLNNMSHNLLFFKKTFWSMILVEKAESQPLKLQSLSSGPKKIPNPH
jgi:hypothetical protein